MIYTHLEMVQLILSAMDSDEVNSISDTVESNQVSLLLRSVYYDIITDIGLPEHEGLFELLASGDNAKPCQMTAPAHAVKVRNIKYNYKEAADTYSDYQEIKFKKFEDFLADQQSLRENTSGVGQQTFVSNGDSFEFLFMTDRMPSYWTTYDDRTYLFDSHDSTLDTTLQKSKTMCQGIIYPDYTLADSFTPDLSPAQFSFFINRAKVRAFAELKQSDNREAAGEARRQKIIVQKRKQSSPDQPMVYKAPRFGRK